MRRQTARMRLSKYAAHDTYHHCEQCQQYLGFRPRGQVGRRPPGTALGHRFHPARRHRGPVLSMFSFRSGRWKVLEALAALQSPRILGSLPRSAYLLPTPRGSELPGRHLPQRRCALAAEVLLPLRPSSFKSSVQQTLPECFSRTRHRHRGE